MKMFSGGGASTSVKLPQKRAGSSSEPEDEAAALLAPAASRSSLEEAVPRVHFAATGSSPAASLQEHILVDSHFVVDMQSQSVPSPVSAMPFSPAPDAMASLGQDYLSSLASDARIEVASSYADEEPAELSREDMQMIKARTMFNMFEEVDGGSQGLLFLTNRQADLLASPDNVAKLVDSLEVYGYVHYKPKLLILLQWDACFRAQMGAAGPGNTFHNQHELTNGAFLDGADARAAESRLDR